MVALYQFVYLCISFWRAESEKYHKQNHTLIDAVLEGNVAQIQKFLQGGADINGHYSRSFPPLFTAIIGEQTKVIEYLLKQGADANLIYNGETPLTFAVKHDQLSMIPLLLAHKADPNMRNFEGLTALDLAKEENNREAIKLLEPVTTVSEGKRRYLIDMP